MVDARLPGRWLNSPQHDELSDAAWRVYSYGLMYAAEQGTDGFIPTRALRLLHPSGTNQAAVLELVERGHWATVDGGVRHVNWDHTQTTAEQLEHQRGRSRANSKKSRGAKKVTATEPDVTEHVTEHVPADVTVPRQGKARQGEERPGKATRGEAEPAHARDASGPRQPPAHQSLPAAPPRSGGGWGAVQVPGEPGRWVKVLGGPPAVWCGAHGEGLDDDGWCPTCLDTSVSARASSSSAASR